MSENIFYAKKACVFLNGNIEDYNKIKEIYNKNEYGTIIAVDGGANHLRKLGIEPNYVIGDLDSIDNETEEYLLSTNVIFKKFPEKKNETDSELAVLLAHELGILKLDIYAAIGGRIDHEIGNIFLLDYIYKKDMYPRIISENQQIYIVENDELSVTGKIGDLISVIPIKGDALGVTLRNLEYELENFDMKFSIPRGISNVMTDTIAYILVEEGCLLVIKTCVHK